MTRQYRSIRSNNGKRLRGGAQPALVKLSRFKNPNAVRNKFDDSILESIRRLNRKYPTLYNVIAQFNVADANGDGHINMDEFVNLMTSLRFTNMNRRELFVHIDADNSGTIDLKEFLVFHKYMVMFNQVDTNHDGHIDQAEFQELMIKLGSADVEANTEIFNGIDFDGNGFIDMLDFLLIMMFDQADSDGSGTISYEEYVKKFANFGKITKKEFSSVDTDGTGLDLKKFITLWANLKS